MRAAIERADVVISGGGGLLQNVTSLRSLLYYAGIVRAATRAGKPTMIFAQSVGPLDFWGRAVVRECCGGVSRATVRDERSRALLAPLVPKVTVERTADPVFLFEPGGEPLDLAAKASTATSSAGRRVRPALAGCRGDALAAGRAPTGWPALTARASRFCRWADRPTPTCRRVIRRASRRRCCCRTTPSRKPRR